VRFAAPFALLLLLLIPVVLWATRRRSRPTLSFSGLALIEPAGRSLRQRVTWLPRALRIIAVGTLVVAVARPQTGFGEVRTTANGIAMVTVVDRSASMKEMMPFEGERVSRIRAVKKVFKDFINGDGKDLKGRPEDLIGLVTFARFADTLAPLTRSHDPLTKIVDGILLADERSAEAGTAIGEGVALAAARLKQAEEDIERLAREQATRGPRLPKPDDKAKPSEDDPETEFSIKSKIIILMTDGDENVGDISAQQAAELCKQWGIKIYAVGIGSDDGGGTLMNTQMGAFRIQTGRGGVNDQLLKDIAGSTGGKYYAATDGASLKAIYADIDALEKTEIKSTQYTSYSETFWWWAAAGGAALALEMLLASTWLRRSP